MAAGCGPAANDWMPLAQGSRWDFAVRSGFLIAVEPVMVVGRSSVGTVEGARLNGPMGPSRLAWLGNDLLASELAGTRFSPPVTLLKVGAKDATWEWRGKVQSAGVWVPATVAFTQQSGTFTIPKSENSLTSLTVVAKLSAAGMTRETQLTFARDLGVVRQETREDGKFVASIEYLSGP